MKYTYKFLTDDQTVELDSKWVNILSEFDKKEQANQKAESRNHYHFEACEFEGNDFIDKNDVLTNLYKEIIDEEKFCIAFYKLKPKQRKLLLTRYYYGVSVNEIAREEGVTSAAISQRIKTAQNNLKKFLKKT